MTGIKLKRKPSQKSIFLKPSLVVGNTKTWVSIGETMQEIATKEELSTMSGAKLVGTSSIGYIDGAICKAIQYEVNTGTIGKYNDYLVKIGTGGYSGLIMMFKLTSDLKKNISLPDIDFDYIVLRPAPTNSLLVPIFNIESDKIYERGVNIPMTKANYNSDIIVYNDYPIITRIVLSTEQFNPAYTLYPVTLKITASSLTKQLTIESMSEGSYSWTANADFRSAIWIDERPIDLGTEWSLVSGPNFGMYTVLYYKY